jgi:4,5-dihydroxyphthalate decarboxylase
MANGGTMLRVALGDYPHTLPLKRGEITSPWLKLEFVEVKPLYQAFKPMVREHAFDASEMALVTYFQAKDHNKGLTLLPAAMLARFQHGTMLFNAERGELDPSGLSGKRIGVRSYSQTTGVWIRGILENDYGVDLGGVQWVTFEDGHVAEAGDPAGVIRARKGQDITEMLIAGELDAAVYGAALPKDPRLQSVIPDPEAAPRGWYGEHGLGPRNHLVVVTEEIVRSNPKAVAELYLLLEEGRKAVPPSGKTDTAPFGKDANRPCLKLLMSYCEQQKLISRRLNFDELW